MEKNEQVWYSLRMTVIQTRKGISSLPRSYTRALFIPPTRVPVRFKSQRNIRNPDYFLLFRINHKPTMLCQQKSKLKSEILSSHTLVVELNLSTMTRN